MAGWSAVEMKKQSNGECITMESISEVKTKGRELLKERDNSSNHMIN